MYVMTLALALILTPFAHAAGPLTGTWKLDHLECTSGARHATFGPSFEGTVDVTVEATDTELTTTVEQTVRLKAEYAARTRDQINSALMKAQTGPGGPGRDAQLKRLLEGLAALDRYAPGLTCMTSAKTKYALSGQTIRFEKAFEHHSTCPEKSTEAGGEATFALDGDTLRVTDTGPATESGDACPVGDHVVTTYRRSK